MTVSTQDPYHAQ
jgi:AraC-like DNA-binding protein